jgi:transposase InsO family protein
VCDEPAIEHRLTKVNHPLRRLLPAVLAGSGSMACWPSMDQWSGRAKEPHDQEPALGLDPGDATVKRYHYDRHDQLKAHLQLFVDAYNHARRLKTLRGLTPYEFIWQAWAKEPNRFRLDPSHHIPGPYT